MTAYQITSMMEGVIQRGTGYVVHDLGYPIAGKTGTTNDEKDAWFIGFTPNLVVGLYMGYDQPTPMGRGSTGGGLAAPVFQRIHDAGAEGAAQDRLQDARRHEADRDQPQDRHARRAGRPDTIMEAFKPGTGPADSYWVIGNNEEYDLSGKAQELSPQASQAISSGAGGLY